MSQKTLRIVLDVAVRDLDDETLFRHAQDAMCEVKELGGTLADQQPAELAARIAEVIPQVNEQMFEGSNEFVEFGEVTVISSEWAA